MLHSETNRYWVVVPAAGSGVRMGGGVPKQYLPLGGKLIIEHTLQRLASHPSISGMVVVLAPGDRYWPKVRLPQGAPVVTTEGGAERCQSVLNGLRKLAEKAAQHDWVLVHDAARPCLRHADIDKLLLTLSNHPVGGLLGLCSTNTKKRTDSQGQVIATVERAGLWRALTPQMFRLGPLMSALEQAISQGVLVTDESAAMESTGQAPLMVEGSPDNIKITRREDLALAAFYMMEQEQAASQEPVEVRNP